MKTLTQYLIVCTIFFIAINCGHENKLQNVSEEKEAKKMLKEFYTAYLKTFEHYFKSNAGHPELLTAKIDSIKTKYLTKELLIHLDSVFKDQMLDYDLFIKGQMLDTIILNTLTIKKDSARNNLYNISYSWYDKKIAATIRVIVKKENDLYKIDHLYIEGIDEEYEPQTGDKSK